MQIAVIFLMVVCGTRAQDVYSLANYINDNGIHFFQINELVKISTSLAQQLCAGSTVQQLFDNLGKTVQNNIGGTTAVNGMAVGQKLGNDLGNDASATANAAENAAIEAFTAALEDISQHCGSGVDVVLAQANNYANAQFTQVVFDQLHQWISAVNPNDWNIVRNDLGPYMYFSTYGY
ncbi:hypothetical protein QR680_015748 [Steinernema hermaphroditum]|uniref:Uncharacterized protein n=1 Tax=Steinernema hermaphroditum TaxID=289476 RepID=A0AA39LLA0_9BILA|nr:hypothetical protein QR680_015748 [Steinernema hermaphroditum]